MMFLVLIYARPVDATETFYDSLKFMGVWFFILYLPYIIIGLICVGLFTTLYIFIFNNKKDIKNNDSFSVNLFRMIILFGIFWALFFIVNSLIF